MTARRVIVFLALVALTSDAVALARPRSAGDPPEGQAFTLLALKHEKAGDQTRILIESSSPPLYTVFRPTDRLIIVDLPGGEGSKLAPEYEVNNELVGSIAVRHSPERAASAAARSATRIEISLREDVNDRSQVDKNTLVIELSREKSTGQAATPTADFKKPQETAPSHGVYVHPAPVSTKPITPTTEKSQPRPAVLRPARLVHSVRAERSQDGARVFIETDGEPKFKDFVLSSPWRVVVDIEGVDSPLGNKTEQVNHSGVERVRVGRPSPGVIRVVVDLKSNMPHRVVRDGASLVVLVGAATSSGSAALPAAKGPEVRVAGERVENRQPVNASQKDQSASAPLIAQTRQPAGQPSATSQPASQPSGGNASVRETIIQPAGAVSRPPASVNRPAPQPAGDARPAPQQRSELAFCDPSYVGGLISFDLRAGVDLRDMLRFISQQYGVNFIVDKSVTAVPVDIRVNDMPWNHVIESVMRANRLGWVCESGGRMIRIATLLAIKEEEEQQRAILEEQAKKTPLVTKIMHLKYARAVGALGQTGTGASGRSSGSSGGAGGMTGGAASRGTILAIAEKRLSPRGRIEVEMRTNTLIVTDLPDYVQAVSDIIDELDKPEPQVEIEARIVIASRNFLRDIGSEVAGAAVNLDRGTAGLLATSPVQFNPGGGLQPGGQSQSGSGGTGGSGGSGSDSQQKGLGPNLIGPFATEALRNATANTVLSLTTGAIGTGILSAALSASETKGQIRTIASPRITAQDNQTAEIVNGVQIPVQTVSNNTITTTFVTAALRLEITPQIVEETGEVLMHVVAENNTVNFALANQFNNGTPGINTQSAQSIVRVQDGGTTVMGGINIDTEGQTVNRTPGLSSLPVIGYLFKRKTTRRDFDEILFFITPRIVRSDGQPGPKTLAPQRSSAEPARTEGTQRAEGTEAAKTPATAEKARAASKGGGQ